MESSKDWLNLLFYLAPILVTCGAIYLLVKGFFERDYKIKLIETKKLVQKDLIPLRFQAYERVTLFLERISPNNLLYRVYRKGMTARELQSELLETIRMEFEHNVTQQVYMSNHAWQLVRNAKEDTVRIINLASDKTDAEAPGAELSKKIFEFMLQNENFPAQKALDFVKIEASQLF